MADYTDILSRRLVEVTDGTVEPVLVHAGKTPAKAIEIDFPFVDASGTQSTATLANTVRDLSNEAKGCAVVLLEYSGYGYAKRGAPLWLMRGLSRVCGERGIPLLTVFHEISASGPIWTSAFWLSPLQTYVARRLAQLSSGLITTHPAGYDELKSAVGEDTSIKVRSVFSNVGEPRSYPCFKGRPDRAVVFGGRRTKTALYETHREATEAGLTRWGIDAIVDLGPTGALQPEAFEINVDVRGLQPAEAISEELLNARLGLLHYPAAYATKSGILAAYMAHGTVPVLVEPSPLGGQLSSGTHFVTWYKDQNSKEGAGVGELISQSAAQWYDQHAHSRHAARTVLKLIENAFDLPVVYPTSPSSE